MPTRWRPACERSWPNATYGRGAHQTLFVPLPTLQVITSRESTPVGPKIRAALAGRLRRAQTSLTYLGHRKLTGLARGLIVLVPDLPSRLNVSSVRDHGAPAPPDDLRGNRTGAVCDDTADPAPGPVSTTAVDDPDGATSGKRSGRSRRFDSSAHWQPCPVRLERVAREGRGSPVQAAPVIFRDGI